MRNNLFISLFLLVMTVLQSCNNDEPMISENLLPHSSILDPENLGPTYCHVLDSTDLELLKDQSIYYYLPEKRQPDSNEYWERLEASLHHEPLSYRNMRLLLCQGWVGKNHADDLTEDDRRAGSEYSSFMAEAKNKLTLTPEEKDSVNQASPNGTVWDEYQSYKYSICVFTIARHTGEFSITADQTLFGKPAGTDLSEHFLVEAENKCLPQGSLQDFHFVFWYGQEQPELNARQFFAKDTWLQEEHVLWLRDIPEEQHDIVRFTIQMPVICEYWMKYFREYLDEVPIVEKVFTYTCTVQFGKTSTFKDDFPALYATNPRIEWMKY